MEKGVQKALETAIADQEIAGAVALVTDSDQTLSLMTAGHFDLESETPMPDDALFCIASMTKPVTAVAALMMVEENRLSLDDKLSQYLPEFTGPKDKDGRPVEVTIRQCLSHTSGMSDLSLEEEDECRSLADLIPRIISKPVGFPPGSEWCYCQTSINMVARVVEVLSGIDFPTFLRERIFEPLEMIDTTFYPDRGQTARIASIYGRSDEGVWEKASHDWVTHGRLGSRDRYPKANAGLFSTVGDYAKFCRCLLRGGEGIVSGESCRELGAVQTGDLETGFTPGNAWGLGCAVTVNPQGVTRMLSSGTFGHGGLYGTQGWIDPVRGRAYLLMVQRSDFENADGSRVREAFQEIAAGEV